MICPSCLKCSIHPYSKDKFRSYLLCLSCSLVFVPRDQLVSEEKEKRRYDDHLNHEEDKIYKEYLDQLVFQTSPHLSRQMKGLDFGCGRSTLLQKLFHRQAFDVRSYDLFYHFDESVFDSLYDFIIMSEVIEHLRKPREELERLRKCLKPQGKLFIKTCLRPSCSDKFDNWYYKRDITHIQFYSMDSLQVLAKELSLSGPRELGNDLFLMRDDC